jgi:hypothetical protein
MSANEENTELNYREQPSSSARSEGGAEPQLLELAVPSSTTSDSQQTLRRPVGRPLGSKTRQLDPEVMLQEELLQMLKLAQSARKFAEDQLQRLAEASAGADNIKTKVEIAKTAVSLTSELTKTAGNIIEQLRKQPGALGGGNSNESSFSFEEWLKTQ